MLAGGLLLYNESFIIKEHFWEQQTGPLLCPIFFQVTDLRKIRSVARPPRDKKKHAVVLTFKDDSPKAFACDSGEFGKHELNVVLN